MKNIIINIFVYTSQINKKWNNEEYWEEELKIDKLEEEDEKIKFKIMRNDRIYTGR